MIGNLRGVVWSIGDDWVIVDVGGVGYEVHCSSRVLGALPARGEAIELAIETHVRETEIRLFGFENEAERQWFRLLQSVQGVGAKSALAILGVLSVADLANAVALQDKAMVARAHGVGPKVAGRIVSELRDKAPALSMAGGAAGAAAPGGAIETGALEEMAASDAVSALVNLGYARSEAGAAVAAALRNAGDDDSTQTLIRLGLKELAR